MKDPKDYVDRIAPDWSDPDCSWTLKEMEASGIDLSMMKSIECGLAFVQEQEFGIDEWYKLSGELQKKHADKLFFYSTRPSTGRVIRHVQEDD